MTRKILLLESELLEMMCKLESTLSIQEELFLEEDKESGYVLLDRLFYYISNAIRYRYKVGNYEKCKEEMFEYIVTVISDYKKVSSEKLNSRHLTLYFIYMNSCKYDVNFSSHDALQILDLLLESNLTRDDSRETGIKTELIQEKIEVLLSESELDVDALIEANKKLKSLLHK